MHLRWHHRRPIGLGNYATELERQLLWLECHYYLSQVCDLMSKLTNLLQCFVWYSFSRENFPFVRSKLVQITEDWKGMNHAGMIMCGTVPKSQPKLINYCRQRQRTHFRTRRNFYFCSLENFMRQSQRKQFAWSAEKEKEKNKQNVRRKEKKKLSTKQFLKVLCFI